LKFGRHNRQPRSPQTPLEFATIVSIDPASIDKASTDVRADFLILPPRRLSPFCHGLTVMQQTGWEPVKPPPL
jgi:hypothetical protein